MLRTARGCDHQPREMCSCSSALHVLNPTHKTSLEPQIHGTAAGAATDGSGASITTMTRAHRLLPHPTPRSTFKARKLISAPSGLFCCCWIPSTSKTKREAGWERPTLPGPTAGAGAEAASIAAPRAPLDGSTGAPVCRGFLLSGFFVSKYLYLRLCEKLFRITWPIQKCHHSRCVLGEY